MLTASHKQLQCDCLPPGIFSDVKLEVQLLVLRMNHASESEVKG